MPSPSPSIRILLIRSWVHRLAPVREALLAGGISARFLRVDIEPALNAALTRGGIDLIIYDRSSVAITCETVEARCKEHRPHVPLISVDNLDDLDDLVERARLALEGLRN